MDNKVTRNTFKLGDHVISNYKNCGVRGQCSKTSREGKEPNCLKVVFSWFVKRMMCQACLLGTGTRQD